MLRGSSGPHADRILIHAPYGRDAVLIQNELRAAGFSSVVCDSIEALCSSLAEGGGAALIADEALVPDAVSQLEEKLKSQPPWSDFPVLVMTSGGKATGAIRYRLQLLEPLTNVTLLERPLRPETLVSSVKAALRARRRQYELREVLSELAENNGALKRSNDRLTRVNRELEEFGYVASHDLQEPLRMVNVYTELMIRKLGAVDADLNQYAAFITQGVLRMQSLIRDLLTFSRTVHDERTGDTADLSAALAEAIGVLHGRIRENNAVIRTENLPVVRGDPQQMAQVFQNLLSNAIKYRRDSEPPNIEIAARKCPGEWIISVRDNGIGFDQQYAEGIFALFKRLHKDEYPGTGLGLAICRRVVERYGGRIWATGDTSTGSTFYFALPAA